LISHQLNTGWLGGLGKNGHWQADLIDFQKYNERGFKWILTVVDVFSKYLWALPLKNKSAEEVKEAFSCIFKERRLIVLQTDNGKEFRNTVLADYLRLWGIKQVYSRLSQYKSPPQE